MVIMEKGHYGQYTGNARHSRTPVTRGNYKASERDDAAHIDYLKRDVKYDAKHGGSDKQMTNDEKHISKLAGDMKYDKKHHSPLNNTGTPVVDEFGNPVPADFVSDAPEVVGTRILSDLNEGNLPTMFGGKQVGSNERVQGIKTARRNIKDRNYTQSEIDTYNKGQATGMTPYVNKY